VDAAQVKRAKGDATTFEQLPDLADQCSDDGLDAETAAA